MHCRSDGSWYSLEYQCNLSDTDRTRASAKQQPRVKTKFQMAGRDINGSRADSRTQSERCPVQDKRIIEITPHLPKLSEK